MASSDHSDGSGYKSFRRALVELDRSTFVTVIKALRLPLAYVEALARQSGMNAIVEDAESGHTGTLPPLSFLSFMLLGIEKREC